MAEPLLRVSNLKTGFKFGKRFALAVDDVSFSLFPGETLGVVGESGSGKSVTALSIMRLLARDTAKVVGGTVTFGTTDVLGLSQRKMRQMRGRKIAMIFQEPMTSLNPLFTVAFQIGEALSLHLGLKGAAKEKRIIELLDLVKIPDAKNTLDRYPHELSGGMRQRVMIAMAISCNPEVLIADEPTTALDVTVQAQILNLLADLQEELNMAMMLITHDLGVVSRICDQVMVLYGGKVAERGPVAKVFSRPGHPYTKGLLASIPVVGQVVDELATIDGTVPAIGQFPKGCRFLNRCPRKSEVCHSPPPTVTLADSAEPKGQQEQLQEVSCFHPHSQS